jgi:hypothetical protein
MDGAINQARELLEHPFDWPEGSGGEFLFTGGKMTTLPVPAGRQRGESLRDQ